MSYIFEENLTITLPKGAENPVVAEILANYTFGRQWNINYGDGLFIKIGNGTPCSPSGFEYAINIENGGVFISSDSFSGVMRGLLTFLEKLKYDDKSDVFYAECGLLKEKGSISLRCVHLCVFPETDLEFLKKCIRSCAISKFTHVILEFWGTLKFDAMKELSWPMAHSRDKIKEIAKEANALGVEIIPMFNHLGHAAASREIMGKHVVLDQNPALCNLFKTCGWIWNYEREDVKSLLKSVRRELIEICGEGEYFHIGCDEAYGEGKSENDAKELCNYLNEVSSDLKTLGRRPIMWHDMLLTNEEFPGYITKGTQPGANIILKELSKDIIMADWQYCAMGEVWKTSQALKRAGFDTVCCPWDNKGNIEEAVKTVMEKGLFGIIHTTWNTLEKGFRYMIYAGAISFDASLLGNVVFSNLYASHVARVAMPAKGEYEKGGWSKKQTGGLL